MTRRPPPIWLIAAIAAEAAIAIVNAAAGGSTVPTATYLIPPLVLAVVERPRRVALVGFLAVVLTIASGSWNDNFGTVDHILRIALAAVAAGLAVLSSNARTQLLGSRREAVAARRVAEAISRRLDAMLGALAEAVTVHDAAGKTIYANKAAVRLLGAESLDEVLAARPGDLAQRFIITKEDGSPVQVEDFPGRRVVADQRAEPLLTRSVLRETGELSWLLTKATAVRDEDGQLVAVNIIEDVTEAKEAELRQRFLAEATQTLASSLDYDETLERVAWLAVPTFADWCAVDVVDEAGDRERVALAHRDPEKLALGQRLEEAYPADLDADAGLGAVLRGGDAELYPELPDALLAEGAQDERHLELIRAVGMRSAMLVPMRLGDRTIGALTFVNGVSERVFDADDLRFAQDLAVRAATAVENSRLYTRLARNAHTLQASLLPERLVQPPGWRVAASYRAGERGSEVGGDFYDVFQVGDDWMVVLGDVTGKGVRAAAQTALVRHTAKTAARFDSSPPAVLELVNGVLREQPELSIVTLVVARLRSDPRGGAEVTVASAGHPLPLRVRAAAAEPIGHYDVVLGAVDEGEWSESRTTLEAGETLLFYTDGVTDMPGASERFGDARLLAAAAAGPTAAGALIDRIEDALSGFELGERSDDRALLAVELLPAPVPAVARD